MTDCVAARNSELGFARRGGYWQILVNVVTLRGNLEALLCLTEHPGKSEHCES